MTPATSDLVDAWLDARANGYHTLSSAAGRLGVKPKALEYAIKKAREANDPRLPDSLRKTQPAFDDVLSVHPVMAATIHEIDGDREAAAACIRRNAADDTEAATFLWMILDIPQEARP